MKMKKNIFKIAAGPIFALFLCIMFIIMDVYFIIAFHSIIAFFSIAVLLGCSYVNIKTIKYRIKRNQEVDQYLYSSKYFED